MNERLSPKLTDSGLALENKSINKSVNFRSLMITSLGSYIQINNRYLYTVPVSDDLRDNFSQS